MEKIEVITRSLAFWNGWWYGESGYESVLRKEYLDDLIPLLGLKEAIILLGVRRSGKSTLMSQLIQHLLQEHPPENICYVNFDDNSLVPFIKDPGFLDELFDIYIEEKNPKGKIYLFFDEVQNLEGWERWVKKIYDKNQEIKFVLTGSSSSLLKKEYSSLLTGRQITREVYPLSFREFLAFNNFKVADKGYLLKNRPRIRRFLTDYMKYGGFPEVVLQKSDRLKVEQLKNYFTGIIARDVLMRYNIRDAGKIENLGYMLIANISNLLSARKLGNAIKSSPNTVLDYLRILEEVYLVFCVPYFSYSVKEQLSKPRKLYCIDQGLRNAAGFSFSEDFGRIAENIVFLHLKRQGFDVYYWKGKKGREIDFVVKSGMEIVGLYQVSWEIDEKVKERETKALKEGMKHFNVKKSTVITRDYLFEDGEITFIPLWIWLVGDGI